MLQPEHFLAEIRRRSCYLHERSSVMDNLMKPVQEYIDHDASGLVQTSGAAFDFRAVYYGFPPEYLLKWGNKKATSNQRWQKYFSKSPQQGQLTLRSSEYMDGFFESEEYRTLYEPSSLKYSLQTMFFNTSGAMLGVYAVNRFRPPLNEVDFSDEEKALFDRLAPYLFLALLKYRWIMEYDYFNLTSLNDTFLGVLVADTAGRITFMNEAASQILKVSHRNMPARLTPQLEAAKERLKSVYKGKGASLELLRNIGIRSPYGYTVAFNFDRQYPLRQPAGHKEGTIFFLDVIRINREIIESLSKRETEVIRLIVCGKPDKEIADLLSLSEKTVQTYIRNIFQKLGVSNRTEAAVMAMKLGLD